MGSLPDSMPRLPAEAPRALRMDRLAWRAGACFASHGVRIGVRSNDPAVLAQLPSVLPPGWQPAPSSLVDRVFSVWVGAGRSARRVRVYDGTTRLACSWDLSRALPVLESVLRLRVAEASPELVFVHAGVVAWRGQAVLLPGRSRSGKTTLVAELVRAGATYLSDEFAPLDSEGRVHPFAKALTIRGGEGCDLHARRCRAEDLGGCVGQQALPVGLVAFTEHRPGASWQPETLTHGQGVLEMLAHTVPARLRPEAALEALAHTLAGARLLRSARGEAAITARLLVETLASRASGPDAPQEA